MKPPSLGINRLQLISLVNSMRLRENNSQNEASRSNYFSSIISGVFNEGIVVLMEST